MPEGAGFSAAIECVRGITARKELSDQHKYTENNKKLKHKNGSFITTKKDPYMHGFGIISIKKIVSKYNGNVSFSSNLEEFVVNISIPLPQHLN